MFVYNLNPVSHIVLLIIFRIPQHELEARIDAVDATLVKDTCYKYIYDRCSVQMSDS